MLLNRFVIAFIPTLLLTLAGLARADVGDNRSDVSPSCGSAAARGIFCGKDNDKDSDDDRDNGRGNDDRSDSKSDDNDNAASKIEKLIAELEQLCKDSDRCDDDHCDRDGRGNSDQGDKGDKDSSTADDSAPSNETPKPARVVPPKDYRKFDHYGKDGSNSQLVPPTTFPANTLGHH